MFQKYLLAAALLLAACSRPAPAPEPVRAVRTQVLQASETQVRLSYAAELRARTESRLSFRVGGKLARREVHLGATARPGRWTWSSRCLSSRWPAFASWPPAAACRCR